MSHDTRIRVSGQGLPGPPGPPGPEVLIEELSTAGGVGSVPTSDGAGAVTMQIPAGGGDVTSPGGETAGRVTKFTGSKTIAETATTETELAIAVTHSGITTGNPHDLDATDVGAEPAGAIATHTSDGDAHHPQAHTVASHSDTTATGAELDTLTDGSNADALHTHAVGGGSGDFVGPGSSVANNLVGFADTTGKLGEDSGIAPAQVPTQGENDALVGTDGTPATGNPYVTDSDPRNTDARVPTAHTHVEADITDLDHTDTDAVHVNVNSEFGGIADEISPAGTVRLLAELATGEKRRVDVGNLPTGGGGEANDLANAGTGISGVATPSKVGINLQARGYASGNDRITVSADVPNENVVHTLNEGNIVHQNLSGSGTNDHAAIDAHILDSESAINRNSKTGLTVEFTNILTINGGDNTKFDVAAGTGHILDFTVDPENPTRVPLSWSPFVAQTVPNLATEVVTTVYIEDTGGGVPGIFTNNVVTTPELRRSKILIGVVAHPDNLVIFETISNPIMGIDTGSCLDDFLIATGDFNVSGNQFTANGANLLLDRSAGVSFGRVLSSALDNPHFKSTGLEPAITPYFYSIRDGLTGDFLIALETELQPQNYDLNGVLTAVGTNDFSIQRIIFEPRAGNTFIEYGQTTYNTLVTAIDGILENAISKNPQLREAVLRGWVISRNNVTDLAAAIIGGTAVIREAITEISQPSGAGFDTNAIHVNQVGEISTIATKVTPIATDILVIEDAAASFAKKQLELGDFITALTGPDADTRIATHAALGDAHHAESHTIVSHSDTTATGAELDTLTDGSDADALHDHALADTHIADVTGNPHVVTAAQAGAEPSGSIATHAALPNVHHAEAHTIASHSDTTATGAELDELTDGSETVLHTHAGIGTPEFADDVFRIQDNLDATKEIAFQASGITTATTRTITVPDANITIDDVGDPRTPAAHTIASHSDTTATGAELDELTDGSTTTLHNHAGGGGSEFDDDVFRIRDDVDTSKQIAFQASGITTSTVRTITVPDADITIDDVSDTRTPAAHTIASHSDTTATGAELDELTDGSTTTLHNHAGGGGSTEFALPIQAPHFVESNTAAIFESETARDVNELVVRSGSLTDGAGGSFTFDAFHGPTLASLTFIGTVTITQGGERGVNTLGAPVTTVADDIFVVNTTAIGAFPVGTAARRQRFYMHFRSTAG